jgi:glyoxylase-like metal-dependent hydrolase (beta-lactamase superfamily II)
MADKLVLVDSGVSAHDMAHPLRGLGLGMAWGGGARHGTTALEHVRRLGYSAGDVTDILMTHLDKDHAGGLADFPQARVHVHADELRAGTERASFVDRQRYNPRHFAHSLQWEPYPNDNHIEWFGLEATVPADFTGSILVVYLSGHSAGHCGIAVRTGEGKWLLHCGDAVYHPAWLSGGRPPLVIQTVETVLEHDGAARHSSREKLQALMSNPDVTVFCSHDRAMFEALGGVE